MSNKGDYNILRQAAQLFQPEQRKKEWYEELEEEVCSVCPTLTYQQRIGGCAVCMFVGFLLSLGSLSRLVQLMAGRPESFAVMYSIGNIISICSTCFLYGPWSQAKKMFHSTRIFATCAFFLCMAICLFLAFYPHYIPLRVILLVVAIFLQFLALSWYTISFIPFARDIVKSFFKSVCCANCSNLCQEEEKNDSSFFGLL